MGRRTILRFAASMCLLAASVGAALLLCEVILRITGFWNPRFHEADAILGTSLHPGAEGLYRFEGESYVKINSAGFRDREHSRSKPAGTVRIAILGDSYAEALAVPMEETFWWVMQDRLNACSGFGGKKVEVLNFGVEGHGTAQELLMLENRVWDYSPDMVLLVFFAGNDPRNNSKVLEPDKLRPFFVLRNGRLQLDDSFQDVPAFRAGEHRILGSFRDWLSYHSRMYQLLGLVKRRLNQRVSEGAGHRLKGDELGVERLAFAEPTTEDWSEAWLVTEALITRMRDEVAARGARFLVVSVSAGMQVTPDSTARREYARALGVKDLFYPERRLLSLGARNNIEVLTLAPTLLKYAEENDVILHGFDEERKRSEGHYNKVGHRIAGETIARHLCRQNIHDTETDTAAVQR